MRWKLVYVDLDTNERRDCVDDAAVVITGDYGAIEDLQRELNADRSYPWSSYQIMPVWPL